MIHLEFNEAHNIHFSKERFIGNTIRVNNSVDENRLKRAFPVYEMNIELRPEIEGRKSNIVIDIDYCDYTENFDFKENYKALTNKHVKEIMEEIALEKRLREKSAKDSLAYQKAIHQDNEKKRKALEERLVQEQMAKRDSMAEAQRLALLEKTRLDALEK